jgi:hypothetical protein
MFAHTLKSVIKLASLNVNKSIISLQGIDPKSNRIYKFDIHVDRIDVKISVGELEGIHSITDIECLNLPPYLNMTKWSQVSFASDGSIYREQHSNLHFDAQLFVELFRIVRERAFFTMKLNGKYVDAWYLEGKVLYVVENEKQLVVHGTDLYKLAQTDRDYRILTVDKLPAFLDYRRFIDEKRALAGVLRKEFVQLKPDRAV